MTACKNNRMARTIPGKDDQRNYNPWPLQSLAKTTIPGKNKRGHNYKDPYLVQQGRIRTEHGI